MAIVKPSWRWLRYQVFDWLVLEANEKDPVLQW